LACLQNSRPQSLSLGWQYLFVVIISLHPSCITQNQLIYQLSYKLYPLEETMINSQIAQKKYELKF
jgi:hypothetical protein